MTEYILEKLSLPKDEAEIIGKQLRARDDAIGYALKGIIDNKEQLERKFGNYSGMQAMVWLIGELTELLDDGPAIKLKED